MVSIININSFPTVCHWNSGSECETLKEWITIMWIRLIMIFLTVQVFTSKDNLFASNSQAHQIQCTAPENFFTFEEDQNFQFFHPGMHFLTLCVPTALAKTLLGTRIKGRRNPSLLRNFHRDHFTDLLYSGQKELEKIFQRTFDHNSHQNFKAPQ